MNILHLTLKRKWFDMIESGIKLEEYRQIKPYWIQRLCKGHSGCLVGDFMNPDAVHFRNGYSKDARTMLIECKGIRIGDNGNPEWGFEERCFIISLGKKIEQQSVKQVNEIIKGKI